MQIPRRKSEELRKRDDGPVHLTREGLKRLQEKLERLKRSLPALIAETEAAAAHGDRSENAEYKEAKSALRRARWQILDIQDKLRRAEIITPGPSERVRLGSTVVLEMRGTERTFEILGSHETDPAKGRISYQSPLGAALMQHVKGDEVIVRMEGGSLTCRILDIR